MHCLLGMSLSAAAAGQAPLFRDETAVRLPAGLAGQCMDAAAGDADGDGDLDIALAMEFRPNLLLFNDGRGVFTLRSGRLPVTRHDSEDVAFADFDRDGDADLVLVSEDDRSDELYLNAGDGRFTDVSERLVPQDVSNALAIIDLDQDGAPDILTGNIGTNRVLINDGSARFTDRTAELWPQDGDSRTQDIEIADVDGDGDDDVIVANEGQNELYLNSQGVLSNATARALPSRIDETREIRAADLDGDGDLDLVVANVSFLMAVSPRDYLLINDGTGVFSEGPQRFPEGERNNFTIQVADLDGDADLDVIVPDTQFPRSRGDFRVLLNDGGGEFDIAEPGLVIASDVDGNGFDIEVADFDGDGLADLFLCNRASVPSVQEAAETGGRQRLLMRSPGGD